MTTEKYDRDRSDRLEKKIKSSLKVYSDSSLCDDGKRINAGVDILRWANQGFLKVYKSVSPNEFMDWYPRDQGFVILRLAKRGLITINKEKIRGK